MISNEKSMNYKVVDLIEIYIFVMTRVRYNIASHFGLLKEATYRTPVEIPGALSKIDHGELINSPCKHLRITTVRPTTKAEENPYLD